MSCGRKEIASPMIISINEYQNVVPSELFIERIDSILINDKNHGYISTVEDVCVGDSSIYVLDASAKLIKINQFNRTSRDIKVS